MFSTLHQHSGALTGESLHRNLVHRFSSHFSLVITSNYKLNSELWHAILSKINQNLDSPWSCTANSVDYSLVIFQCFFNIKFQCYDTVYSSTCLSTLQVLLPGRWYKVFLILVLTNWSSLILVSGIKYTIIEIIVMQHVV